MLADHSRDLRDDQRQPDAIADDHGGEAAVARETEYYLANIGNVKSIDDFLGNKRLFTFAMKAFGLQDMTYAKAFMRKVLTEGVDNSKSFANTLSDPRYREFAQAFNFARYGDTTTIFDRTPPGRPSTATCARRSRRMPARRTRACGLRSTSSARPPVINSPYGILADRGAPEGGRRRRSASLPPSSAMDIDRQAQMITARLDVDDLKDPDKLQKFLGRFASLWDMDNPASTTSTSVGHLLASPSRSGSAQDLLASLQNLKLGGT